ncbi:hypothetical protein COLO4_06829 [Corchorus olitorius]|uniref:Uncharacterized protein n=1 Tax=Corchorus olitorius TaxID=93759 RepID=A0A1R3KLU5_9ROSI|nr:hypothetical protein COLO4_06829 [Corchorus olitorius]
MTLNHNAIVIDNAAPVTKRFSMRTGRNCGTFSFIKQVEPLLFISMGNSIMKRLGTFTRARFLSGS